MRHLIVDGFFLLVLIALSIAFFNILSPFFIDIFIAVIITHFFFPVFLFFRTKLKLRRRRSSLLSVLTVLLFFALPLTLVGILVSSEISHSMETLKNRMPLIRQTINSIISLADPGHYSFFKRYLPDIKLDQLIEPLNDLLKTGTNITFRLIQRLFFNTAFFIAHFALVLVMVFFLFLDGKTLLEKINSLIPLKQSEGNEMIREIIRVIDATVFGTFIIGLIEGAFGGLIFFVFGIPAPVLWGIVMMIFSMIPVVGTNTIIWPAGIMQIAIGNRVTGTLMLLFGFVGITATQNLLKPKLLGDRAGLHPAFVLLSVIGGIYWLGIIGFIVGPLLTTLFLVIWNQFGIRFKHELEMRNKSDTGSST